MRHLILGTAGHVDHGKTALVKALTGVDTDRLKEEKERGITIELGFTSLDLPGGLRLGIIDVPGHEKFVKNMVAGAGGIDIVALVIAADEGVMPQTREHLEICSLLGTRYGLVALTKIDMVDTDWLLLVQEDVREFLKGSFLADAPIIPVSALTRQGLGDFVSTLESIASKVIESPDSGIFRLPIDRVFTMRGFGTVVTGTIISGRLVNGENIEIMPRRIPAKVRGIQVHNQPAPAVEAGQRTAVNLQGIDKESVERGEVLVHAGIFEPGNRLDVRLEYLSSTPKKLKNRALLRFHCGTAETICRVVLLEGEEMTPGSEAYAQIVLEKPHIAMSGDRFVLRSYSPVRTVGGGKVLDPLAEKHKKSQSQAVEEMKALDTAAAPERAALIIHRSGMAGISALQLAVRAGLAPIETEELLTSMVAAGQCIPLEKEWQRLVSSELYSRLKENLVEEIKKYHLSNPLKTGISREELRSGFGYGVDPRLFAAAIKDLEDSRRVFLDRDVVRLPLHKVDLKGDLDDIRSRILGAYAGAQLSPPTHKELLENFGDKKRQAEDVLKVMLNDGLLVKVSEDLYYSREVLEKIKKDYHGLLVRKGKANPASFKELTGLTRKFIIPLMEYFDKIKFTIRVGDSRVLRDKN